MCSYVGVSVVEVIFGYVLGCNFWDVSKLSEFVCVGGVHWQCLCWGNGCGCVQEE